MSKRDPKQIGRVLARLRQEGANILVVGNCPTAHEELSRILFADGEPDKQRLFVGLSPTIGTDALSAETVASDIETVLLQTAERGGCSAQHAGATGNGSAHQSDVTEVESIAELGATVAERCKQMRTRVPTAPAGDIRVGFDSLNSLVEIEGDEGAIQFLNIFHNCITTHEAVAHYHLIDERGSFYHKYFESFLDAIIGVRKNGSTIEHRWQTNDLRTAWLSTDDI